MVLQNFLMNTIIKGGLKFVEKNAPAILIAEGVFCLVTSAAEAWFEGHKAQEKLTEAKRQAKIKGEHFGMKEAAKMIYKHVLKVVVPGVIGVALIASGNKAYVTKIGTLTTAYLIKAEEAKYHAQIVEKAKDVVGETKINKIKNDIAQEKIDQNPPPARTTEMMTGGKMWCALSMGSMNTFFISDKPSIQSVLWDLDNKLTVRDFVSIEELIRELPIKNQYSSPWPMELGWNLSSGRIKDNVDIELGEAPNGDPCLYVTLNNVETKHGLGEYHEVRKW